MDKSPFDPPSSGTTFSSPKNYTADFMLIVTIVAVAAIVWKVFFADNSLTEQHFVTPDLSDLRALNSAGPGPDHSKN